MLYDNTTRQFNYRDKNISENFIGNYTVHVIIGDDNWKGSKFSNYTLNIEVKMPNSATYRDAEVDKSFKGADIVDMGITG